MLRFIDEREQETEPSQTRLRWRGESHVEYPPGDYRHLRRFSTLLSIAPTENIPAECKAAFTLTMFIDPWRFGFYPAGREHLATLRLQVDIEGKSGVLRRLPDTCLGRSGRLLWPHAAECRGLCAEQPH